MSTPNYLPGTLLTQADVDAVLKRAASGLETWFHALASLQPSGLAEIPIWYVTIVTAAVKAGSISQAQAQELLSTVIVEGAVPEPQSLYQAWASLMQTLVVTWPKRRKATLAAVERMNTAVARARRTALHG